MALQLFVGPWPLFQFIHFYAVGRTPWAVDQPVARPLPAHRTSQTQNKRTDIHAGFQPTIPVFEQAKTIHASDRVASLIGPTTQR
jgi:hypothetical protein